MISRRTALSAIAAKILCFGFAGPALAAPSAVKMFDTDNDGSLDLQEVKKAATELFDRLDRDKDGTLDRRELAGRLGAADFRTA
ncbi:EF-hand domain-containing protein, partial [Acinetobacter baumannii]